MIAFHKWSNLIQEEGDDDDDDVTDDITEDKYSFQLWREGILVKYDQGFILVEGFKDDHVRNLY